MFAGMHGDVLPLLQSPAQVVAELAACCLTAVANEVGTDEKVAAFIERALGAGVGLRLAGLRLAGVISSSYAGSKFLENAGIVPRVAELLGDRESEVRRLAVMVFASVSVSFPMAKAAPGVVDVFFRGLQEDSLAPYPMIAIANLTVNPAAAALAAKHVPELVERLKTADDANLSRILTAIHRIVMTPEAHGNLTDDRALSELVLWTEPFWEKDYSSVVFDILDFVSGVPGCRQTLVASGLQRYLKNQLRERPLADSQRPLLMRILSRIGIE
jgi:hypothetical protein